MSYIYYIHYRGADGKTVWYITDSAELYRAELAQLRAEKKKILRYWRERI